MKAWVGFSKNCHFNLSIFFGKMEIALFKYKYINAHAGLFVNLATFSYILL